MRIGKGGGLAFLGLVLGLALFAPAARAELPADSEALLDLYTQASARTFRLAAILDERTAQEGAALDLGKSGLLLTRLSAVSKDGGKTRARRILLYARPELGEGSPNRPQEPFTTATLSAFDAKLDLALLKPQKALPPAPALQVGQGGGEAFVIAFPRGQAWTMSVGRVSQKDDELLFAGSLDQRLIGTPLFDGTGALLGLLRPAKNAQDGARFGASAALLAWLKKQKALAPASPAKAPAPAKPLALRPGLVYPPQSFETLHTLKTPPKAVVPPKTGEPKETSE